jgi:hypothetical protein
MGLMNVWLIQIQLQSGVEYNEKFKF